MTADHARVKRLRRLERIRALAKEQAAREAAEAEGTLAQLEALVARTRTMAAEYRDVRPVDGLALRQVGQFVSGLDQIARATGDNASQARLHADRKQDDLARAEQRRAVVEDRIAEARRRQQQRTETPATGARGALGTPLE